MGVGLVADGLDFHRPGQLGLNSSRLEHRA